MDHRFGASSLAFARGMTEARPRASGAENDFDGGAAPRGRLERERAADRRRALAHVLQALPRAAVADLEPCAVVAHGHQPVDAALADHDPRTTCARMLARVAQALLHDAEHLDLLVR